MGRTRSLFKLCALASIAAALIRVSTTVLSVTTGAKKPVAEPRPPRRASNSTAVLDGRSWARDLAAPATNHAERRIVWLLSFPNSGTSYTLKLVRSATGGATATNYGEESHFRRGDTGANVPVVALSPDGPYWTSTSAAHDAEGLVLTKTHCGGRCANCSAEKYLETLDTFRDACRTGKRYAIAASPGSDGAGGGVADESGSVGASASERGRKQVKIFNKDLEIVRYDARWLVAKAVHLVRNPFDNVVARFHLAHKRARKKGTDAEFATQFPDDREGFRSWCRSMDERPSFVDAERRRSRDLVGGEEIVRSFQEVPCHAEFYRYAQWHNLAYETVAAMGGVPELTLRYERYGTDFDAAVDSIVSFLERESSGPGRGSRKDLSVFVAGKRYRDYFTREEHGNAEVLLRLASSNVTWDQIGHYFQSSSATA